jgi:hypothetical protein
MENWIAVDCEFLQLCRFFQGWNVLEFFYPIVRKENTLESRTVLQTMDWLNKVTPQVKLCQRDKTVQILNCCD